MTGVIDLLAEARSRELEQALFYRHLAGDAELAGDAARAERLNELLADEQHHVSRLTARVLELGGRPSDQRPVLDPPPSLEGWEEVARRREAEEVAWYEAALTRTSDAPTLAVLRGILASERQHLAHLGGKWMPAGPGGTEEES